MSPKRPTHTTVVAYLALFVAIGGTAAALPGKNTVNSGDVVNETLKTADLKDGAAVQGSDVIDGSVANDDLADDSVRRDQIQEDGVDAEEIATSAVTEDEIGFAAVEQGELADNAVGTGEIVDLGVTGADIAAAQVDESKLPAIDVANGNTFNFGDQAAENGQWLSGDSTATCPAGTRVIGGGVTLIGDSIGGNDEIAVSQSLRSGNGWAVKMISDTDDVDFAARAYCLN